MKFAAILAAAFAIVSGVQGHTITDELGSLTGGGRYSLSTLGSLASSDKVSAILNGPGPLSFFAPTNAAFDALFAAQPNLRASLLANDDLLVSVIQYHVIPGLAFSPSSPTTFIAKTGLAAPGLGANATQNIVVKVTANPTAVSLLFGLGTAKVIDSVTTANGVIHVIDTVLLAPTKPSDTAVAANLTEIVGALTAANLVSTVDSLVNTTIFVPTNAAFQAIKSITGNLTTAQLGGVLTYHVLAASYGAVFSPAVASLPNNTALNTLAQQPITLTFTGSTPVLRGVGNTAAVKLVTTDILVSNGVLHLIDAVLIPDVAKLPTQTNGTSGSGGSPTNSSSTASPTASSGATSMTLSAFALVIIAICTVFML